MTRFSPVREALLLLLIAALPAALAAGRLYPIPEPVTPRVASESGEIPLRPGEVTLDTALAWDSSVLWIDARSRHAFESEHIPDALLLNEDEWEKLVPVVLEAWSPERRIVVYCDGAECERSHHVAERLRSEMALENVHVLRGGWEIWNATRR